MINSIGEVFYAYQYRTSVLGYREPHWWPEAGEGKFDTEGAAERAALAEGKRRGEPVRLVRIERTVRFIEIEQDLSRRHQVNRGVVK